MMRLPAGLFVALALLGVHAQGQDPIAARVELRQGVEAFKNAEYPKAVEHFQAAVRLDPKFLNARLYLASAYMSQYVPGNAAPENVAMAEAALDGFRKALELEPDNELATESMASLFFTQKKLDESKEWYEKLIAVNPRKKETYYNLGVIAWTKTYQPLREARSRMGMRPEDPGPLKDEKIRTELAVSNMPVIEAGIANLQKALEIDPDYDDAMGYLSLSYRARADLEGSPEASVNDVKLADEWLRKTLEIKKRKTLPNRPQ